MKKILVAAGIVSLMASTTAFALSFAPGKTNKAGDGVVLSKHNMNSYTDTTHDVEGRVCAFCHTPHHALADNTVDNLADYLPLWSHQLTTQVGFNVYASPTFGTIDNSRTLSGVTMLCMSCHDGVVAVDQHYNQNNTSNAKLSDDSFGGTSIGLKDANGNASFENDHPIGFMWSDAIAKYPNDLNPDSTPFAGNTKNKTIADQLTGGSGGLFTCATCHDVHNKDSVPNSLGTATRNYFLLGDNNGSAFCLTCHIK